MEEKKDWKELLHKSLRSMQLGFSGSQVDWIDNFVESVEQEAERRGFEKAIKKIIAEYGENYNNGCGCCSTKYLEDELPKLLEEENGKQKTTK